MNLYPSGEGLQRVSPNLNIKHNITEDQLCFTGNREGNKKESPHFCLFHPPIPLSCSEEPGAFLLFKAYLMFCFLMQCSLFIVQSISYHFFLIYLFLIEG